MVPYREMTQSYQVNSGSIARVISGIVIAVAGLIAVGPQPTSLIWKTSVLLSEWGHWLALPAVLLLPGWRRSWVDATGSVLSCLGIILLLSPLVRAYPLNHTLPTDLDQVFGPAVSPSPSTQQVRPAPLVATDLFFGISSTDIVVDEHIYAVLEGETLALDLYRPAFAEGMLPVVIVIHGGGWTGGDKRDIPELSEYLASRGYIVANIGYRLAPKWGFPSAQHDVAAAIEYIKNLEYTHSVDPTRIALLGRSAGGQIALLAAYRANDPAIRGVISFYGPFALRWGYDNPAKPGVVDSSGILEMYLGGTPDTHSATYDAAEPSRFVTSSSPPTLFIQGLRDEHVSPFHAEFVSTRLLDAGVKHFVVRMPWATHSCDYIFTGPCGQISTFAVERFLGSILVGTD